MRNIPLAIGAAALALTALGGAVVHAQAHDHSGPAAATPGGAMRGQMPAGPMTRANAQAMAAAMFARMDANRDGKLDAADRSARQADHFARMDTNKDGAISRSEFDSAHAQGHEEMSGAGGKMSGGMRGMRMLAQMDANGDKAISRDEFLGGALKRFDGADANRDGTLTPEERRAAMGAHRGGGGMRGMGGADHDAMDD